MNTQMIFTTYYTGKPNPQKTAKKAIPDDFEMIKGWWESIVKNKLQGCIFHDGLSREFVSQYQNENVRFIHVPYISNRSVNDERFYVYLKYLTQHPEIKWLLCTDLFDVTFQKNPFEYINQKDKIFIGSENTEVVNFSVIKNNAKRAYKKTSPWWDLLDVLTFNAGIVGGHRDIMLKLLRIMIQEFSCVDYKINANMFVLCKSIIENRITTVTGPPLHSKYKEYEKEGNFYICHK